LRPFADDAARVHGPQALRTAAIVAILFYTGIRVGELVGADVDRLGHDRGHRVLRFTGKGDRDHPDRAGGWPPTSTPERT